MTKSTASSISGRRAIARNRFFARNDFCAYDEPTTISFFFSRQQKKNERKTGQMRACTEHRFVKYRLYGHNERSRARATDRTLIYNIRRFKFRITVRNEVNSIIYT